MSTGKKQLEKSRLHSRNKNKDRYDLKALIHVIPKLKNYLVTNKFGVESLDFSNPVAVKLLNQALLYHYYGIKHWEFPDENLCPPVPGRADYIHYIADLLSTDNFGAIPKGNQITCLDIGTGASCIYPIIGVVEYGWNFIASDISPKSITSAQNIVNSNSSIKDKIKCKLQKSPKNFFHGIINKEDQIDLTICNPPFHASIEEAQKGTRRKIKNLTGKKTKTPTLNFAGINNELVYEGGEYQFIQHMITESKLFSKNCYWFSTLVSKQSNLKAISRLLKNIGALQVKTIPMGTGNKSSRIVAWTFLSKEAQKEWRKSKWLDQA